MPEFFWVLVNHIRNDAVQGASLRQICEDAKVRYKQTPDVPQDLQLPHYDSIRKIKEVTDLYNKLDTGQLRRDEERFFTTSNMSELDKLSIEDTELLMRCRVEADILNSPLTLREAKWVLRWKHLGLRSASTTDSLNAFRTTGVTFMYMNSFEDQYAYDLSILDIAKHYASEELGSVNWEDRSIELDNFWTNTHNWELGNQIVNLPLASLGYMHDLDKRLFIKKCILSLPYYRTDVHKIIEVCTQKKHLWGNTGEEEMHNARETIKGILGNNLEKIMDKLESYLNEYLKRKKEFREGYKTYWRYDAIPGVKKKNGKYSHPDIIDSDNPWSKFEYKDNGEAVHFDIETGKVRRQVESEEEIKAGNYVENLTEQEPPCHYSFFEFWAESGLEWE